MSIPRNVYVAPAIPYVNDVPHLGHAILHVYADVIARYYRKMGHPVLLSSGTDEHGEKIAEKAEESGETLKQFIDKNSQSFRDLLQLLEISTDKFIRTSDPEHEHIATIVWKNLSDHIYKGKYSGWYCVGCEKYVTDTECKENNGVCPHHNREYTKLEEENYFFKLSSFGDRILALIESRSFEVYPENRRQEIIAQLKEGLDDISVSRPKDKIDWGISVPGDSSQVMYVWFEALMNYITLLGYPDGENFKKFWPAHTQVVGKDILRFHAAIWPAMLLGLGLPLPKRLFAHSFILSGGKKMSKTLGNVVAPKEIVDKFGSEAFRYYFMRHIPADSDGDFTWERFGKTYSSELANEYGNAVNRVASMILRYQDGVIGKIPESIHDEARYHEAMAVCRFDKALEEVWHLVRGLNQFIDQEKPWELVRLDDTDHLKEVLAYAVSCILQISDLLEPFMPKTAIKTEAIFASGVITEAPKPLFPKIEE